MATLKIISDIKFFLKNPETTEAFSKDITTFSSTYPNATFNNVAPTINPNVNLIDLSNKYEIKKPTFLGSGGIDTGYPNLTSATDIFETCHVGDLLLYGDDPDNLQIFGTIETIVSDAEVTISNTFDEDIGPVDIYVFSKYNEAKSFGFNDSFYMVIKNPNIVSSKHEGIVNIDTTINSPTALVFAYGNNRIANPSFFSLKRISEKTKYSEGLTSTEITNEENIQCFITGISTLSEQSNDVIVEISDAQIPLWSVYEVNPYGITDSHFIANTTYRLTVCDVDSKLPMKAISQDSVIPPEA